MKFLMPLMALFMSFAASAETCDRSQIGRQAQYLERAAADFQNVVYYASDYMSLSYASSELKFQGNRLANYALGTAASCRDLVNYFRRDLEPIAFDLRTRHDATQAHLPDIRVRAAFDRVWQALGGLTFAIKSYQP